jgi:hypothetical protein
LNGTVCAVVPTYNRANLVSECLDSLLAQTRPIHRIIVVDDGSSDATPSVLRAYAGRVCIIRQENAGKAAALNLGLSQCQSDYVWVCDDDDVAEPDACATLAGALDANPAAGFSYARFQRFADVPDGRAVLPMSYWPDAHEADLFLTLLERCFIFQFSSMVRREVFDRVGLFDTALLRSQDYDMILRVARLYRGVYTAKPVFLQRQHDGIRGPAADCISAQDMAQKWLAYDRIIFGRLMADLSIEEATPAFAKRVGPEERKRAACLQRACIFGRHAMWTQCLAELEKAGLILPDVPASPGEQELAARTLMEAGMVRILANDEALVKRLRAFVKTTVLGRSIARSLAAPLFWQIRNDLEFLQMRAVLERFRVLKAVKGLVPGLRRSPLAAKKASPIARQGLASQ